MIDPVQMYENRYYLETKIKVIYDNLVKHKEEMKYRVVPDFINFVNIQIKNINKILAYSVRNEDLSARMKKRRAVSYICNDLIKDVLSGVNEYTRKEKRLVNAINEFRHKVLDIQTPILLQNLEYITTYTLDASNYDSFISCLENCLKIYKEINDDISILDAMKEMGDTRCY